MTLAVGKCLVQGFLNSFRYFSEEEKGKWTGGGTVRAPCEHQAWISEVLPLPHLCFPASHRRRQIFNICAVSYTLIAPPPKADSWGLLPAVRRCWVPLFALQQGVPAL